jgi:hypothetical protein
MEQNCVISLDREEDAGNPATIEVGPNLKQSIAHGTTGGHADRPAEFHRPDIVTDSLAILGTQPTQPIAHRLRSGTGLVESGRQPFHSPHVPKMVQLSKAVEWARRGTVNTARAALSTSKYSMQR